MQTNDKDSSGVKTVETAFDILELIKELDGLTLGEVAEELGMAKSTAHRHLKTLERREYAVAEGNVYYPGLRFLEFGEFTRTRQAGFNMVRETVDELAEKTDERIQFMVEEHGMGVHLYRAIGSNAIWRNHAIGQRVYLHSIAAGKAVLAYLPEDRVDEIIAQRGLPKLTDRTIATREDLFEELATVRERGFAFNNQETTEGLHAVGVPIMGTDDTVIGSLSASGPAHRFVDEWYEEELPYHLRGAANELELNIAHSNRP